MSLSDLSPIEEWLKKFTYKEGFTWEYRAPNTLDGLRLHDGILVIHTPNWQDSRNLTTESQGHFFFPINFRLFDGPNGEALFKRWFRQRIHEVELHEVDEWLLYEGSREWDPHGTPHQR